MLDSKAYQAAEAMVRSFEAPFTKVSTPQLILALTFLHTEGPTSIGKLEARVAEHCGCSWTDVEQNLRYVKQNIMLNGNQRRLREVMGFLMRRKPSTANFVDAIDCYMEDHGLWPPC